CPRPAPPRLAETGWRGASPCPSGASTRTRIPRTCPCPICPAPTPPPLTKPWPPSPWRTRTWSASVPPRSSTERPRRRSRWCTQQLSLLLGWLIKNRGRRTSTPSSETLTLPASGWQVRPERNADGPRSGPEHCIDVGELLEPRECSFVRDLSCGSKEPIPRGTRQCAPHADPSYSQLRRLRHGRERSVDQEIDRFR